MSAIVPDLTAAQGAFDLTLTKMGVKLDGADNAFQYTLDLVFPITGRGVAEQLEEQIPGLANAFDQAIEEGDNWRASSTVKSGADVRAVLHAKAAGGGIAQGPVEPGGVIVQGSARVLFVRSDLSKRQQRVLVRVCMGGQPVTVATLLASNLERLVTFSFERNQQELPFSRTSARPALRVGMVVTLSGDVGERGKVVELDGELVTMREDGVEKVVHATEVVSAISFSDDVNTDEALRDYQERCQRRGYAPSWGVLVDVLTHADADTVSGTYSVTLDHVEQAVAAMDALAESGSTTRPNSDPDVDETVVPRNRSEAAQALSAEMEATPGPAQEAAPAVSDEPVQGDAGPNNVVQLKQPKDGKRKPRGQAIAS